MRKNQINTSIHNSCEYTHTIYILECRKKGMFAHWIFLLHDDSNFKHKRLLFRKFPFFKFIGKKSDRRKPILPKFTETKFSFNLHIEMVRLMELVLSQCSMSKKCILVCKSSQNL